MCRHLAPLSRPPLRLFFSPFMPPFGPCLSGGEPAQLGAGRGDGLRRRQTPSICLEPRGFEPFCHYCSIEATAFLALYALCVAYQVLARLSQHAGAGVYHFGVLRRPSAMPVEHVPAEKGPVCAPYKEGDPKSRRARSLTGSARKQTRQEVGAPPPPHSAGALGRSPRPPPIFNFGRGRFLGGCVCWRRWAGRYSAAPAAACSLQWNKRGGASFSSFDER